MVLNGVILVKEELVVQFQCALAHREIYCPIEIRLKLHNKKLLVHSKIDGYIRHKNMNLSSENKNKHTSVCVVVATAGPILIFGWRRLSNYTRDV